MKRKLLRNFTALFTALCIPLSVYTADIPTKSAYARAETSPNVSTYDYYDPTTKSMKSAMATAVTSGDTTLSEGWYVVDSVLEITSRIKISGNVNIILADNGKLTDNKGITVDSGDTLTIWGQEQGTGTLHIDMNCDNNDRQSGIGGKQGSGLITINGGTIYSRAGNHSAGIGGGNEGGTSYITIAELPK